MNAKSGNDGSALANLNTWSKTTEHIPSVAVKDSTTVAMSSTGAIKARSSRPRIRITRPG